MVTDGRPTYFVPMLEIRPGLIAEYQASPDLEDWSTSVLSLASSNYLGIPGLALFRVDLGSFYDELYFRMRYTVVTR